MYGWGGSWMTLCSVWHPVTPCNDVRTVVKAFERLVTCSVNRSNARTYDSWRSFKLRLNFAFCSQASVVFCRPSKILKIIVYTLYLCFNARKIELLNLMISVCRYSAIAAWDLWNCNPRPVSFYIRNPHRLSNPERLHYKMKLHGKQMTSNCNFPAVYAHRVWWDVFW